MTAQANKFFHAESWFPTFLVSCTPATLSSELKYPFTDNP